MKYFKQKIMHDPKNGQWGDCYKTALACIMDLDLDDVPHFCDNDPSREVFEERVTRWLAKFDLTKVILGLRCTPEEMMELMAVQNPGKVYLLSGKSPRHEASHVVIAKDNEIIHDPHPDGTGLDGPDDQYASWVEFLVPLKIHQGAT